jgi:hypothetical protein
MSPNGKKLMTSGAGVREWIASTKVWNFGSSPTSQLPKSTEGKEQFEEALRKANRKVKK